MRTSWSWIVVFGVSLVGCVADSTEESAEEQMKKADLFGDFHVESRTSKEAFLFDDAVAELSLTTDKARACHYEAIVATGGCDDAKSCTQTDILAEAAKRKRISGSCTIAGAVLTLKTGSTSIDLRTRPFRSGRASGIEVVSVAGKKLSRQG